MDFLSTLGYIYAPNVMNALQGERATEAVNNIINTNDYNKLRDFKIPNVGDPRYVAEIDKFRKEKIDQLLGAEAAPVAGITRQWTQEGNRPTTDSLAQFAVAKTLYPTDKNFSQDEWDKGLKRQPAIFSGSTENPKINAIIMDFVDKNRQFDTALKGAKAIRTNSINPYSSMDNQTLAETLTNDKIFGNIKDAAALGKTSFDNRDKQKSLEDFATAQKLAAENLGFINSGKNKEDYLTAPEIRDITSNNLSRFSLSPEQRNTINHMVDKGLSDKWIEKRAKTPKGELLSQYNPYTGEVKDKVENTTIIHNASSKDKNPVLYSIIKPDGRMVNIDASTPEGRKRLNAAISNGEKITKLTSESTSETTFNDNGTSTTRRVTGPVVAQSANIKPNIKESVKQETGISKSGKPIIKINGTWVYAQ